MPLASIAALCRSLLSEGVPLKAFRRIAEAMVDAAREETDPVQLVEGVRPRIGGLIVQSLVPLKMPQPGMTHDTALASLLNQAVRSGTESRNPTTHSHGHNIYVAAGADDGTRLGEVRCS